MYTSNLLNMQLLDILSLCEYTAMHHAIEMLISLQISVYFTSMIIACIVCYKFYYTGLTVQPLCNS